MGRANLDGRGCGPEPAQLYLILYLVALYARNRIPAPRTLAGIGASPDKT